MKFFKVVFASALGYLLGAFLILFITISIIAGLASKATPKPSVSDQSVLHITMNYPVNDRTFDNDPFAVVSSMDPDFDLPVGLNDILKCIDYAKEDESIKGIILDLNAIQCGFAKLSEIRSEIQSFKESGKFVYAYADFYYFTSYYLASVADSIFINPQGEMLFNGLAAEVTFFANTLEKLGIEMQVIRHGKYKGAVESYVRDGLSEENRFQISEYVNSVYNTALGHISESRSKSLEDLKSDANALEMRMNDDFISSGYLDAKIYRDQFYSRMKSKMGLTDEDKVELVSLGKYNKIAKRGGSGERIAVVYATGDIISGKGNQMEIASDNMAKTLKSLRENEKIKAVVLRIDSRGGSSLASDIIWREVELLKKEKPVIVSMSDVAASGGYYISAPATKIVASPMTITGSIGVFGLIPNAQKLLNDKMGVNIEYVGTGDYSDIGRIDRPLKPEEKEYITEIVDHIYVDFITKVSKGRGFSTDSVDQLGQGRVWTGLMAKEVGLVDELGGLRYAIELAAEEAGLEDYKVREYPKLKDPFQQFIHQMQGQSQLELALEQSGFSVYLQTLLDAQQWGSKHSVQMLMPYDLQSDLL